LNEDTLVMQRRFSQSVTSAPPLTTWRGFLFGDENPASGGLKKVTGELKPKGANRVEKLNAGLSRAMPTKLNVALVGMMFGRATFLTTGFALFMMVSPPQDRGRLPAQGPNIPVSYAQRELPR
jgi:hypothetical protein